MSAHQYRVTLEYLGGKHAGPELHKPLSFEAGNHDDLFEIIHNVQRARLFDEDTSAALALGMKLFSEVVLEHRKDPLFQQIFEDYRQYIVQFKARIKEALEQESAGQLPPQEPEID
jgi:hypothetical protein